MHNNDPKLRQLLNLQLNNIGNTHHFRYTTEGRRASGEVNTGCGNTLIVLMVCRAYARSRGLNMKFYLDGDDVIVCSETKLDSDDVHRYHLNLGLEVTMQVQDEDALVHCQTTPIMTDPPIMVRRPWDTISKGLTSQKYLWDEKTSYHYLGQLGRCELALHRGVPVMQSYCQMLIRVSDQHSAPSKRDYSDEFTFRRKQALKLGCRSPMEVTPDARVSFELAFGIVSDEQRLLESMFDKVNDLPWE